MINVSFFHHQLLWFYHSFNPMKCISIVCKPNKFELWKFLKFSFTDIWCIHSNDWLTNWILHKGHQTDVLSEPMHPLPKKLTQKK